MLEQLGGVTVRGAIRLLNDYEKVERFIEDAIGIREIDNPNFSEMCQKILDAELALLGSNNKCTLNDIEFRDRNYRSDESRVRLRKTIVNELLALCRLDNDDEIRLGCGGALPKDGIVSCDKVAYIVIGLPASGKSEISEVIADKYHAVIVDSDFAKRKFPEFSLQVGAHSTHDESTLVTFGNSGKYRNENSLFSQCIAESYNIVVPKIGYDSSAIKSLAKTMKKDFGYEIHLILVRLDRQEAVRRAYYRFVKTKRYVPLSLVYDGYANDPTITYYDLKRKDKRLFKSFEMISSDVKLGQPKQILERTSYAPLTEKDLQK